MFSYIFGDLYFGSKLIVSRSNRIQLCGSRVLLHAESKSNLLSNKSQAPEASTEAGSKASPTKKKRSRKASVKQKLIYRFILDQMIKYCTIPGRERSKKMEFTMTTTHVIVNVFTSSVKIEAGLTGIDGSLSSRTFPVCDEWKGKINLKHIFSLIQRRINGEKRYGADNYQVGSRLSGFPLSLPHITLPLRLLSFTPKCVFAISKDLTVLNAEISRKYFAGMANISSEVVPISKHVFSRITLRELDFIVKLIKSTGRRPSYVIKTVKQYLDVLSSVISDIESEYSTKDSGK